MRKHKRIISKPLLMLLLAIVLIAPNPVRAQGYSPIHDENGTQLLKDINLRFSGGSPISPTISGGGPATVQSVNNVVNPLLQQGGDIGAQTNSAVAAAAALGGSNVAGVVKLPPGTYASFSTPISLVGYPNITLDCQGASLTYVGSAAVAIDALQNYTLGASANATGGVRNCNVYAPASAPANVVLFRWATCSITRSSTTRSGTLMHPTTWPS